MPQPGDQNVRVRSEIVEPGLGAVSKFKQEMRLFYTDQMVWQRLTTLPEPLSPTNGVVIRACCAATDVRNCRNRMSQFSDCDYDGC